MSSPALAVIIPVFNKFHLTSLCIDSIVKATFNLPLQLFIVDNASNEKSYLPLVSLAEGINRAKGFELIRVIRNDKNLGFSGGVNTGLRAALAQDKFTHFCVLNNDTVLTDFAFDDLVQYATDAITGVVSNSIGNEQVVPVDYNIQGASGYTRDNVRRFAAKWRPEHLNQVIETRMLGFLCVVIPKRILQEVGLLDEDYGLGYYEDDDYCYRARQKGFRLLIVRSAFVHHFGSASFGSLGKPVVNRLFEINKKLFETKHGVSPTGYEESADRALLVEAYFISRSSGDFEEAFRKLRPLLIKPPQGTLKHQLYHALKYRVKATRFGKLAFFIARVVVGREKNLPSRIFRKITRSVSKKLAPHFSRLFYVKSLRKHAATPRKLLIVCPIQSFFNRNQRPQHLARNLAEFGNLVVWIEPEFSKPVAKPYFDKISDNLYVFHSSKLTFDNFYTTAATSPEVTAFTNELKELLGEEAVLKAKWIVESPFWVEFAERFPQSSYYDCMDYHAGFGSSTIEVDLLEDRLLKIARVVFVTSQFLFDYVKNRFPTLRAPVLVRNACSPSDFPLLPIPGVSRKKVGYFGAVAEWFDADLVLELARSCPEFDFEIIGNTMFSKFELAENLPSNLKLMGEKPYSELPALCRDWSAALIPFLVTDLIKATNPVKLYEYYAMGLPVVATEIPEVMICEERASCVPAGAAFAQAIRSEIQNDTPAKRTARRNFALGQTWRSRAEVMDRSIEA